MVAEWETNGIVNQKMNLSLSKAKVNCLDMIIVARRRSEIKENNLVLIPLQLKTNF